MKFTTVILIIGIAMIVAYIIVVVSAGKIIKDNPGLLKLLMI